MTLISLGGHEFNTIRVKDSYSRRAQKFKNDIITNLRTLGLTEDDVIIDLEPVAIKNLPAKATWYFEGFKLSSSYRKCSKYVENLYVISKLIDLEIKSILAGQKSVEEFISDFREEDNFDDEIKKAKEFFGINSETIDFELVNKKYKQMSKDAHPDMPNGSTEKFKALNHAHKILKRELN